MLSKPSIVLVSMFAIINLLWVLKTSLSHIWDFRLLCRLGFNVFSDKVKEPSLTDKIRLTMALGSQALGSIQYLLPGRAYMPYNGTAYVVLWYPHELGKGLSHSADNSTNLDF